MIKKIGGRKILLTYIILVIIVGMYGFMVYKSQVNPGDFSTFCKAIVVLGIGYGGVNGLSKLAGKKNEDKS